jgi:hypothetical protein
MLEGTKEWDKERVKEEKLKEIRERDTIRENNAER